MNERAGLHRRTAGKTHHGKASCGKHQWVCSWVFVKKGIGSEQVITPPRCPECNGLALNLRESRK